MATDKKLKNLMQHAKKTEKRVGALQKQQAENYKDTGLSTKKALRKDYMIVKKQKEEKARLSRKSKRYTES